jgi:hypothetical protein
LTKFTLISCAALAICLSPGSDLARRGPASQGETQAAGKPPEGTDAPKCETVGTDEIAITCTYTATPHTDSEAKNISRLVLNRAVISFDPKDEGNLHLELTFTNEGEGRIFETRQVYFAIDDDHGRNYVRRHLTKVDFSKFAQGECRTFSEELLLAIFRPGHYIIHLWIPDPDPAMKFNAANAFLLSSVGVADPTAGLNILADFTVDARKRSKAK